MKFRPYIRDAAIVLILQAGLSGCEKEIELHLPQSDSKLVVEGWIENGRVAQIILSHTAPYFSAIDSNSLSDFAESHAKVTLYSGTGSEILTLNTNSSYFPPFVYKSVSLTGVSGESYEIEIITGKDTITAITSIPQPVGLDSVWFREDPEKENKGRIWIRLSDDRSRENYYKLMYMRKGKDNQYIATNLSTFSDVLFNGEIVEMGFLRGISSMIALEEENYFETGDTVSLKLCAIDRDQFAYWNIYQNEILAAANPLATSNNQLKSNIQGGLGIWTGYGASYYLVYAK